MRVGCSGFFFFNDTATTEIYTLSLHDALPISPATPKADTVGWGWDSPEAARLSGVRYAPPRQVFGTLGRSEEHTSELQSRLHLVCRLLLEKKKNNTPSAKQHALGWQAGHQRQF